MFDLKYFKQLKEQNYKQEPIVYMLFAYEDLELNTEMPPNEKRTICDERSNIIYSLMKKEGFPEYPCLWSEHNKVKSKIQKIVSINPYIYIYTLCNGNLNIYTKSNSTDEIKSYITQKVTTLISRTL